MSEAVLDWARRERTGLAEAVLCEPKTLPQIAAILEQAEAAGRDLLLTRLSTERHAALVHRFPRLEHDPLGGTGVLRAAPPGDERSGTATGTATGTAPGTATGTATGIGIVTAGTSDLAVAQEAAATLRFHGFAAPIAADLGVAGLWRLLDRLDELRAHRVLIAVAGMEGALFAVLAGLVEAPIVAVPNATGYGVGADGSVALNAALAGCGAGVTVVNVGNGFGAACAAIRIMRMAVPADPPTRGPQRPSDMARTC